VLKRNGIPAADHWFVIESKGKVFYLVAGDEAEAGKWIAAIRRFTISQEGETSSSSTRTVEGNTENDSLVVDDDFDPFATGRRTNYGFDAMATQPPTSKETIIATPGPCIENGFLPPPDTCGYDEIRFSTKCEVDPFQHQPHTRIFFQDGMLFVTRFRVIIKKTNSPTALFNVHMWDIDMVRVDSAHCTISFSTSNSTFSVWVPAPAAVANALFKSFSQIISASIYWPQLVGITKWSYDFASPDPSDVNDPSIVYQAQCSYVGKRASPTFTRYLQSLYSKWDRHLDLTCVASSDEDTASTLGMLEHDQFFLGVSTAKTPKKDAFAVASRVLRKNKTLTLMALRDVGSDEKQITEFCSALRFASAFNALTWIDLSGNALKDSGAKNLAAALASFTHRFTHLDLSNCHISAKGLAAIFDAFMKNIPASIYLEYLDISGNKCDDSACSLLDVWLAKVAECAKSDKEASSCRGLSTLKVASCKATFSAMKSLSQLTSLTELDISDNKLGETSTGIVCGLLKTTVKTFRMVDCAIRKDHHARLVSAFLDPQKKASDLDLEMTCAAVTKGLQPSSLPPDLNNIVTTKQLRRLVLGNVSMPCSHMEQLCRTLATAPFLTSLCLQDVSSDCFVAPGSCFLWGNSLGFLVNKSATLVSLSLHSVPVDVVNTLLFRLSQRSGNLMHLNIGMCNLGDTGAFSVADALPRIKTLRVIEMDDNNIHVEGIHAIACALSNAPNITQVCMERDITREITSLGAKSPFLAGQCLTYANALAFAIGKNAQEAKPLLSTGSAKGISLIEGQSRTGWSSMLPREIRLISPIPEPLPVADMPKSPSTKKKRRAHK